MLALAGSLVFANHDIEGTFDLQKWGVGAADGATLWVEKTSDNRYVVVRESGDRVDRGSGVLDSDEWLEVTFNEAHGAAGGLADAMDGDSATASRSAWYKIQESGRVYGYYQGVDADGNQDWTFEYGSKGADRDMPARPDVDPDPDPVDPDAVVAIVSPRAGNYLVGQSLALSLDPADAELTIDGPAERDGDVLNITGDGPIKLVAKSGGEEVEVELTSLTCKVTEITVLETLEISDARGPHFSRDLGAAADDEGEVVPAAIFKDTNLRVRVKLEASANLTEAATVAIKTNGAVRFDDEITVQSLASGQQFVLESPEALNDGVAVNALELDWVVGDAEAGTTALRVYTTYKSPIKNISMDRRAPNSKLHFEKACTWARGASTNTGNGRESIGYQIDNQMRHYVHPSSIDDGFEPFMFDYPDGADKPTNYDDLPNDWRIRNGDRGVSSLYYPPLEPDEAYEEYENYRNNFGWWVLDNPTYTGGRCNQQAALVCGILGTVGIKAEILYLHRTARSTKNGRPIRQYFYANDGSADGSGPWNFHGVALADMEDGSQWIYDGSFSFPPNRKNGTREWAQNANGPFLKSWGPWYYDDGLGGRPGADEIPHHSTWVGIPPSADELADLNN